MGWSILGTGLAQSDTSLAPVEIDFLLHYYEQEGDHAAVTGGIGTQELTDFANDIIAVIPLDSLSSINLQTSINHYTSASTDAIDSRESSASSKDNRAQFAAGFQRKIKGSAWTWGMGLSGSIESDYISSGLKADLSWLAPDQNRSFSLHSQVFFDTWVVIFPEELRIPGKVSVPTDKRRSVQLSGSFAQVVNPRLQLSFHAELVGQFGLLSTPFHRVYFNVPGEHTIEKLPNRRIKFPLGVRLNYFVSDFLVLRTYYRFYNDSFGLMAHTLNLETPLRTVPWLSIYPFVRTHWQQGARWFAPYAEHAIDAAYYTSDYDLSSFTSLKAGLGISLTPALGLGRFRMGRNRIGRWDSLDLRASRYYRSDGLSAFILGMALGLRL